MCEQLKTKTILIIDDEFSNLRVLALILKSLGFQNIEATENGQKAVEKINQNSYDLILTDMKMPGLSGSDVLHHTKRFDNSPPVIGMSGTPWLLKDEFDAVLSKPFTKTELLKIINSFFSK